MVYLRKKKGEIMQLVPEIVYDFCAWLLLIGVVTTTIVLFITPIIQLIKKGKIDDYFDV
jgi:hypothetical protein